MARQQKTTEYAQSGKVQEYKKWMDPAIIEKHWQEREAVRGHGSWLADY